MPWQHVLVLNAILVFINTVKPVYNDHLMGHFSAFSVELISVAKGHLDELQKAEIVCKSKLVASVFIETH